MSKYSILNSIKTAVKTDIQRFILLPVLNKIFIFKFKQIHALELNWSNCLNTDNNYTVYSDIKTKNKHVFLYTTTY